MDILTHTLSGVAVATTVVHFAKIDIKMGLKIVSLSALAGAMPDIDAISLWSGFDKTFGAFFNLSNNGRVIYSAKYWYSHHAFMHSLAAALMFSTLVGLVSFLTNAALRKNKLTGFAEAIKQNKWLLISTLLAYLVHLLEDMPTPASTWGGVNFFWPSTTYIGGWGNIWWWNNYDIFLIVVSVIILNLIILTIKAIFRFETKKFALAIFILGFAAAIFQIRSRPESYAYSGYTTKYNAYEMASKQYQKDVLGNRVYGFMEALDNKLSIYF